MKYKYFVCYDNMNFEETYQLMSEYGGHFAAMHYFFPSFSSVKDIAWPINYTAKGFHTPRNKSGISVKIPGLELYLEFGVKLWHP